MEAVAESIGLRVLLKLTRYERHRDEYSKQIGYWAIGTSRFSSMSRPFTGAGGHLMFDALLYRAQAGGPDPEVDVC